MLKFFIIICLAAIIFSDSAFAGGCDELPEKIRKCEKYSCKIQVEEYDFIITHNVVGITPNGKCSYNSTVPVPPEAPNDLTLRCLFTKKIREAYSNVTKKAIGMETTEDISADEELVNSALAKDICEIDGL